MKRIGFLFVLLMIGGCGGPPSGVLSGKALFKGEPLEEGTITVTASDNKSYQTVVMAPAGGAYTIKGLPLGEAKISVIGPDSLPEPGTFVDKEPPGGDPERIKQLKAEAAARAAARKTRQPIHHIFRKPETSPLKVTIVQGANPYDINLK